MEKKIRFVLKIFLWILVIPVSYLAISFGLSYITQNEASSYSKKNKNLYLSTNGVHLDIILPVEHIDTGLLQTLINSSEVKYLAFGWGDKEFYLNTPTWGDLTVSTAFSAMFLKGESLIHLTRYKSVRNYWVTVKVNDNQLKKMNEYLVTSFELNGHGNIILLEDKGYANNDDFYKAIGSYSFYHTCNSWVNRALYESDLKCCLWTPFDFPVINLYNDEL